MTPPGHDKALSDRARPLHIADARRGLRHVFVRDLVLGAQIGVHAHEKGREQKIRVNIDLAVAEPEGPIPDELAAVVCYETIANDVRKIIAEGHVNLVETLAEDIARAGLKDERVVSVRVRVEKLQVVADAASVGVEIERFRRDSA